MAFTANEKLADSLIEHSVDVLRVEGNIKSQVLKRLRALRTDIVAHLIDEDPTVYTKKLQKAIDAKITATYDDITQLMSAQTHGLADVEGKFAVKRLNDAMGAKVAKIGLTPGEISDIVDEVLIDGALPAEWWAREAVSMSNSIADLLRKGFQQQQELADIIKQLAGTKAATWKDGAFNRYLNNAVSLAQTEIQTSANTVRLETYKQNADLLDAMQWFSTLDGRTTIICRALDGLTWDIQTGEPIGHDIRFPGPTAHFRCRSTQLPVIKPYKDLPGGVQRKIPESTRASMDGQVAGSVKYEDWLRGKSDDFQKEVLGAGRYNLWKADKLSFVDMIGQDGNPLTLEQLRAKL
jgi:SPP1 gp7 family putative phage head morphogenesis protein